MADPIITHHISNHHAVQGTDAEIRRILAGLMPPAPPICMCCGERVGGQHYVWCTFDGAVSAKHAGGF